MVSVIDLTPRHGGEAYMGGYDRDWNPYWRPAKRAEWFRQYDHVRSEVEAKPPAQLWRTPDDEVAPILKRIHDAAERNDLSADSNEFVTLDADELARLDTYIKSLRAAENDHATLGEVLIDAQAVNNKTGIALKRIMRGFQRSSMWIAITGVLLGATRYAFLHHCTPGL